MTEQEIERIQKILVEIDEGDPRKALEKLLALPSRLQREIRVCMATADAHYECRDDVSAIRYYLRVARHSKKVRYVNHALKSAATCLLNLGLYQESKRLLELIEGESSRDTAVIQNLRTDADIKLEKQAKARAEIQEILE